MRETHIAASVFFNVQKILQREENQRSESTECGDGSLAGRRNAAGRPGYAVLANVSKGLEITRCTHKLRDGGGGGGGGGG